MDTGMDTGREAGVARRLAGVRPGRPLGGGGMVLVPLLSGDDEGSGGAPGEGVGVRPMPEAMARGELLVTEVSPAGVVGALRARNLGDLPVLALEGEEWSGGRQNRVLAASVLIRPGGDVLVPVACSEPGRWHYLGGAAGPALGDSGAMLPPLLRGEVRRARLGRARGAWGRWEEDVGEAVQAAVSGGLEAWRARVGGGGSLGGCQALERARRPGLEELFPWVPRQVGWLVALDGAWHALEVLPSPASCRRWHRKLVRGLVASPCVRVLDIVATVLHPALEEDWLHRARVVLREVARARGGGVSGGIDLGEREGYASPDWLGEGLLLDGRLLHGGWQRRPPRVMSSAALIGGDQVAGMNSAPR